MSTDKRTITRNELYEKVWAKPLKAVGNDLGIKITHLAYLCDRHRIPRPPTGYWSLVKHGKAPLRAELPTCDDAKLATLQLPTPPQPLDADILALAKRAESLVFPVKAEPEDLDPRVESTRRALKGARPNQHHLLSSTEAGGKRALSVLVSSKAIPRVLCYLDALIRSLEAIGGNIRSTMVGAKVMTEVHLAGEHAGSIGIQERCSRVKPDKRKYSELDFLFLGKWDYVPNGRLVVTRDYRITNPYCEDSEDGKRTVEAQLPDLIVELVMAAGRRRIHRREEPKRRRLKEEQERLRKEKETELMYQRIAVARREEKERKQVERLHAEASAWRQARELREYIAAVQSWMIEKHGSIEQGSKYEQWLQWAQAQAARLDPLRTTPPSIEHAESCGS